MKLNIDPDWLLKAAEREDGKIVSVGGLAVKVAREATARQAAYDAVLLWLNLRAEIEGRIIDDGRNGCQCENCAECFAEAFVGTVEAEIAAGGQEGEGCS